MTTLYSGGTYVLTGNEFTVVGGTVSYNYDLNIATLDNPIENITSISCVGVGLDGWVDLTFYSGCKLDSVDLSGNSLDAIYISSDTLKYLNVSGNSLDNLGRHFGSHGLETAGAQNSLKVLNISNTNLSELYPNDLHALVDFDKTGCNFFV